MKFKALLLILLSITLLYACDNNNSSINSNSITSENISSSETTSIQNSTGMVFPWI